MPSSAVTVMVISFAPPSSAISPLLLARGIATLAAASFAVAVTVVVAIAFATSAVYAVTAGANAGASVTP